MTLIAGNIHDSIPFEDLLTGNEKEVYADSAYKSVKHSQLLKQKKIKECITHRAYRHRSLSEDQVQQNDYSPVFVHGLSMLLEY